MKYRISLCISALCFLTAFLIALSARQQGGEALAARIAPEILRFHILANSDSDEDQQLKMEVKGLVIDYVNENLGEEATKETTAAWLLDHSEEIENMAHRYLLSRGKNYPVSLKLTRDYFPTKAYGDMVFPCGTYDAARVILGEGNGHNWWCVLYPRFCFLDEVCKEIPEKSRRELQDKLNQGDYPLLEDHRPDIKIRFFFFPELQPVLPSHSSG